MARITRRKLLKVTGAGAVAAKTGGLAAILATGRAPAYAQATTVHWLRWNDFVPACDQLLRQKILPEAEKQLGIKVNYETVNGNDLQPRITSAMPGSLTTPEGRPVRAQTAPAQFRASLVQATVVKSSVVEASMTLWANRAQKASPASPEGTTTVPLRRCWMRPGADRSAGRSTTTGTMRAGSTQGLKRSTCSTPF